jgi:hypothetical protein
MRINTLCTLFIFTTLLAVSCQSKSEKDPENIAKGIQDMVKERSPGTFATSTDGFYMKATINGKEWVASEMMPPERPARILGVNSKESISLPYDRRDMVVGKKINFKNNAVDLQMNDEVVLYGANVGEMEITKVEDKFAEGKFYLTANGFQSDKKLEVTDGFFRILFK